MNDFFFFFGCGGSSSGGVVGGGDVGVRGRYCCLGVTLKKAVGLVLFVGQSLDGGGCC